MRVADGPGERVETCAEVSGTAEAALCNGTPVDLATISPFRQHSWHPTGRKTTGFKPAFPAFPVISGWRGSRGATRQPLNYCSGLRFSERAARTTGRSLAKEAKRELRDEGRKEITDMTTSTLPLRSSKCRSGARRLCRTTLFAALVLGAPLAHGESADDEAADRRIEITSSAASWDNLSELFLGNTPASPFGDGSVFVMRGELRNKGTSSVHHVVLRYELLDASGKVLHDAEGYNRAAEAMRPDEEGAVRSEQVVPLAPGATDSYRMVFFHDEVPRFASQRVRVVEVHDQPPAGGPAKAAAADPARGATPAAASLTPPAASAAKPLATGKETAQ
jgi:hypothetical protein